MRSSPARPDLRAYEESVRLPIGELTQRLRQTLGAKLVAYLASLQETRTLREWAQGQGEPSPEVEARLRTAYQVATLLLERNSPSVVQTWFQGANELLSDRAPAKILRDADLEDLRPAVLAAARQFAA